MTPEMRDSIRSRAKQIRRRRRGLVGISGAVVVAATAVPVAALTRGPRSETLVVAQPANCPAAGETVNARTGASVTVGRVPKGWEQLQGTVFQPPSDSPYESQFGATYGSPREQAVAAQESHLGGSYTASTFTVVLTLPFVDEPATPPTTNPVTYPPPPIAGQTTSRITVNGYPATLTVRDTAPAGQPPTPAYPETIGITWSPARGTTVAVTGTNIPVPEVEQMAASVTYSTGSISTLAATPAYSVSAGRAEKALPATDHQGVHAALSAWAEIDHVKDPRTTADDYRPAWLVYSRDRQGAFDFAVVDAHTGAILQPVSSTTSGWVTAVTDRSKPACQPPLGMLTRREVAWIAFVGTELPANTQLVMSSGPIANATLNLGSSSPCNWFCDPLVWIVYTPEGRSNLTIVDPFTGLMLGAESGAPIAATGLPPDLAPGPLPSFTATTTTIEQPTPPLSTEASPTTIIVGPSPFQPGTQEPKPAPPGNGRGPNGSCNGTETYPPCGPGVVEYEYYPYTLPSNCSGELYFDGRWWQQGLYEPDSGTTNVWILLNGQNGAGWTGPGAVGLQPAPPPPATCPSTTPQTVPPLSP
jgi:hypothetical protein